MGCTQAKIEPEALTPEDARIIRETWKMVGRETYGEYGQRLMLRYGRIVFIKLNMITGKYSFQLTLLNRTR